MGLMINRGIYKGMLLTKEAPADRAAADQALEVLTKELSGFTTLLETNQKAAEDRFKALEAAKADQGKLVIELSEGVKQHATAYADVIAKQQAIQTAIDLIKKEMDTPLLKGGKELAEKDVLTAISLQRRAFIWKGGDPDDFKEDMDNLVDAKQYRSAVRKLVKYVGIESKRKVISMLSAEEKKAFEAGSLDSAMFSPEMLGIELDCIVECAELLDLYGQVTVGKTTFMYPQVLDYGEIGKYDCDAKCDAEFGPEGNIRYLSGNVSDWRGVFCLQRKVLAEANYDLLGFMYRAAARSHRINRNRALMVGDGVNQPLGWLTANCFPKVKTAGTTFNHIDFRLFYSSVPVEYGPITAVMHQNVFAYLAAMVDGVGRFLIGDGLLTYSPADVRENLRISNCLPDPTDGLTKGSAAAPFTTGDFICAAGAWKTAYYAVSKRPLWIEQWEGQSSAWCVKYQLGADDGGFVGCCPAARILTVGP